MLSQEKKNGSKTYDIIRMPEAFVFDINKRRRTIYNKLAE